MNANELAGCAIDPKRLFNGDAPDMQRMLRQARWYHMQRRLFANRRPRRQFFPLWEMLDRKLDRVQQDSFYDRKLFRWKRWRRKIV